MHFDETDIQIYVSYTDFDSYLPLYRAAPINNKPIKLDSDYSVRECVS